MRNDKLKLFFENDNVIIPFNKVSHIDKKKGGIYVDGLGVSVGESKPWIGEFIKEFKLYTKAIHAPFEIINAISHSEDVD